MARVLVLVWGVVSYLLFFGTLVYVLGFLANVDLLPKTIDSGEVRPLGESVLVNVLLLGLFAVQHSTMARPGFKAVWTRLIPHPIERSTYVLLTSLILGLMCWQWRPLPEAVWHVGHPAGAAVLWGLFAAGAGIVLYSSFLIDHFDLFGLRQVVLYFRGREYAPPHFAERSLYKLVRHPLLAGFIVNFWSTPTMSQGHLLFAVVTTLYILVAIRLEERDLLAALGDDYRRYRQRTSMLLPLFRRRD